MNCLDHLWATIDTHVIRDKNTHRSQSYLSRLPIGCGHACTVRLFRPMSELNSLTLSICMGPVDYVLIASVLMDDRSIGFIR